MKNKLNSHRVAAVIITYNPGAGFRVRLQSIVKQAARTAIIDNGSDATSLNMLKSLSSEMGAVLIANKDNLGIAHALNQSASWAQQNGFEWLLTMDQDSVVVPHMVSALSEILKELLRRDTVVGVLGSNYLNRHGRLKHRTAHSPSSWLERSAVVTSGSIMSIKAWSEIGGFCDELFIDQVDYDYCIRLRKHGYKVYLSKEPLMTHTVGQSTIHSLFGQSLPTSNHSPIRRYYIARNRVYLLKKYLCYDPKFIINEFCNMAFEILGILLFERCKFQKIRYIIMGSYHGIISRMWKLSN